MVQIGMMPKPVNMLQMESVYAKRGSQLVESYSRYSTGCVGTAGGGVGKRLPILANHSTSMVVHLLTH